ncbi:DUF4199 domain-containing protein [Aureibaculum sp. A20]|uniref:DUF4199 domain-containing protein n=1 Tax=Aureibaculum flavum TaxID=2795986 RepID=A0ABS0WTT0_9FLAO|nr:DUF4199 domain-containing protein [Aureibaculum flavum]MBJ2175311.1 DUF4199 domain-containing protein [Aureibaculum flavum]
MNSSIKKIGVNFGLILALLLSLPTLLAYAVSADILVNWWTLIFVFFAVIICGLLVIGYSKKAQEGFISFKDAFTAFFVMLIIAISISTVISIVIFNVVDPEFKNVIKQKNIELVEGQRDWIMSKMVNSTEDEIDDMNAQFDKNLEEMNSKDQYSVGNQIQGLFVFTVFFSVFGLLLAAILKKKEPLN